MKIKENDNEDVKKDMLYVTIDQKVDFHAAYCLKIVETLTTWGLSIFSRDTDTREKTRQNAWK